MSEQQEKRPRGNEWTEIETPAPAIAPCTGTVSASTWVYAKVRVISTLVMAELPDGSGELGLQWHISIARRAKRPHETDVRRALRAFGMVGAEEDNHHPGNARHFWLPLDPSRRVDCECKAEEATVIEPDGYRYTNPHDPAECRACDFQRLTGKPCPFHGAASP